MKVDQTGVRMYPRSNQAKGIQHRQDWRTNMERRQVNVYLSLDVFRDLQVYADTNRLSLSGAARMLLAQSLGGEE